MTKKSDAIISNLRIFILVQVLFVRNFLQLKAVREERTNSPGIKYQIIFITAIIKTFFLNFHSLK
jgi:hypothetical protein